MLRAETTPTVVSQSFILDLPPELVLAILIQCIQVSDDSRKTLHFLSLTCQLLNQLTQLRSIRQFHDNYLIEKFFTGYRTENKFPVRYLNDLMLCLRDLQSSPLVIESDSREIKLAKIALRAEQLFEIMLDLTLNKIIEFKMSKMVHRIRATATMAGGVVRGVNEIDTIPITKTDVREFKTKLKNCTELLYNAQHTINFDEQLTIVQEAYRVLKDCFDNAKPNYFMIFIDIMKHTFFSNPEVSTEQKIMFVINACIEKIDLEMKLLIQPPRVQLVL